MIHTLIELTTVELSVRLRVHLQSGISITLRNNEKNIEGGNFKMLPWKAKVSMYVNLLNIQTMNLCNRLRNLTDKYNSVQHHTVVF